MHNRECTIVHYRERPLTAVVHYRECAVVHYREDRVVYYREHTVHYREHKIGHYREHTRVHYREHTPVHYMEDRVQLCAQYFSTRTDSAHNGTHTLWRQLCGYRDPSILPELLSSHLLTQSTLPDSSCSFGVSLSLSRSSSEVSPIKWSDAISSTKNPTVSDKPWAAYFPFPRNLLSFQHGKPQQNHVVEYCFKMGYICLSC